MLPGATVPRSLADLLAVFRPCFTAPTFPTFVGLLVGLIAQTRRRTVCGMLTGAGLDQVWHHSRAHRMISNARWSGDALGLALADLIVTRLLPADSALTIAVDDTLFKRSGKKVFGAAWHHDGAAKGPKPIGFGNCWVVAGIIVQLPFLSRPVCLPVLTRLWRPRHTGKIAHARQLAELIAARYPDRTVHVVGDAAYVGERLHDVDARITWTSRLKVTSVLHELPPPVGAENPVISCRTGPGACRRDRPRRPPLDRSPHRSPRRTRGRLNRPRSRPRRRDKCGSGYPDPVATEPVPGGTDAATAANDAATPEAAPSGAQSAARTLDGSESTRSVRPAASTRNPSGSRRLPGGALRGMVEDHLRDHPEAAWGPVAIGKALHRSSGAVANALEALVTQNVAQRTSERPKRYRLVDQPESPSDTTATADDAATTVPADASAPIG